MTIVVLDGHALNPGDLSWDELRRYGDVTVHERTPANQVVARARDAAIVLTNKTPLSAETIAALPQLRYIGVLATGYNVVDVQAAHARGIVVCNVPAYGTSSVAQLTFALLLALCHAVERHDQAVHDGAWTHGPDWCFWNTPQRELADKTIGIVGMGNIGRQVAKIADAFGMRVVAHSRRHTDAPPHPGFAWLPLEELLRRSDVVSLHCPLTPETQGLMNAERIALMKPTAFLLNTSRGPLIVEQDLADALNAGRIAGAALDVLGREPPQAENPLLGARNCLITPHIAWATREARSRLMETAVANVGAFLAGAPRNVVLR
jgi:glycerate dehydrogenase